MELTGGTMGRGLTRILLAGALTLCLTLVPAPLLSAPARAAPSNAEDARLTTLFADDARRQDALDPLDMLFRGKFADPATLALLFTDTLDRRMLASARQSLRALQRIDRARLSPNRQLSYDVFLIDKREDIAWLEPDIRALTAVRPLNHFGGLHVELPSLLSSDGAVTYTSTADYRAALAIDIAFAGVLDNTVPRFRQGMRAGVVDSKLTVTNMIAQLDAVLAQPVEQSPFYSPVLAFPASVAEPDRAQLRAEFAAAIRDRIYPAYRRLRTFLAEDYLPAARDQVGLAAMKGGTGLYRKLIERHTTQRLEPDAVHQLGLSEVARIQQEMEGVRREMKFTGTLRQFFDHIRSDPKFHPRTREELAQGFAATARKVDAQIPRFFSRTPKTPLLIQPYPAYREKYEAGGSYNQGSADGKRPGRVLLQRL